MRGVEFTLSLAYSTCYTTTLRAEMRLGTLRVAICVQGCTDLFLSSAPWVSPPLVLSLSPSCPPGGLEPQPAVGNLCPGMPWIWGQLDSRAGSNSRWCLYLCTCHVTPKWDNSSQNFFLNLRNFLYPFTFISLRRRKYGPRGEIFVIIGVFPLPF